jgi:hypothetical protein
MGGCWRLWKGKNGAQEVQDNQKKSSREDHRGAMICLSKQGKYGRPCRWIKKKSGELEWAKGDVLVGESYFGGRGQLMSGGLRCG